MAEMEPEIVKATCLDFTFMIVILSSFLFNSFLFFIYVGIWSISIGSGYLLLLHYVALFRIPIFTILLCSLCEIV